MGIPYYSVAGLAQLFPVAAVFLLIFALLNIRLIVAGLRREASVPSCFVIAWWVLLLPAAFSARFLLWLFGF